jgi:hypothetical protein
MMERWMPLGAFGLIFGVLMIVLARYQSRIYKDYLQRHSAETAKLVEQHRLTQAQVERQVAALDRIATALEQRQP